MKQNDLEKYINERTIRTANYIVKNKCTIRDASKRFCMSKSSIHKDMVCRLPNLSFRLYGQVRDVLDTNKEERTKRGGESTKAKYCALRS